MAPFWNTGTEVAVSITETGQHLNTGDTVSTLKKDVKTDCRQALIAQVARRLDERHIEVTSLATCQQIIDDDRSSRLLLRAVYDTPNLIDLSNKAAGRFVAAVAHCRRQSSERVPVRSDAENGRPTTVA